MGPPAPFPGVDASSSRPPLVPTRKDGGSTSAAASAGPSAPVVVLPPLSQDILYPGLGLRRYTVPEVPLPNDAFNFLGGRVGDEMVSIRVADLRAFHARSLYNWNLLQYVGRDPSSYADDYRRVVEVSLRVDDPVTSSRSRFESRRSDSRVSGHSRSSVIRPTVSLRRADAPSLTSASEASQVTPTADPIQAAHPLKEASRDSKSVSKRTRVD